MSLRALVLVVTALLTVAGCGGNRPGDEPQTAKEKLARDASGADDPKPGGKKWGKWRYQGDRDSCFYEVTGKCFKTEKAACEAARCKAPMRCAATGAAPAQVACKK